jgi:hypothetical protein
VIVGRIDDGQQVVQGLSELPVVKDNSSSQFFKAGKALGDKQAILAEEVCNKPFDKVVVASSGLFVETLTVCSNKFTDLLESTSCILMIDLFIDLRTCAICSATQPNATAHQCAASAS